MNHHFIIFQLKQVNNSLKLHKHFANRSIEVSRWPLPGIHE